MSCHMGSSDRSREAVNVLHKTSFHISLLFLHLFFKSLLFLSITDLQPNSLAGESETLPSSLPPRDRTKKKKDIHSSNNHQGVYRRQKQPLAQTYLPTYQRPDPARWRITGHITYLLENSRSALHVSTSARTGVQRS